MRYRIDIARKLFKFSCAHMTVFPDGTKERLHGHNYYVGVVLELSKASFADMIPFDQIKRAVVELCGRLREHLLIAADNPYFEVVQDTPTDYEFRLCGQRYLVPRVDVIVLPIDNVSVEGLATYITGELLKRLAGVLRHDVVDVVEVRVSESPGQGATCSVTLNDTR